MKKIIDLATVRIYEQTMGVTQREIERIFLKAIGLILADAVKHGKSLQDILQELEELNGKK